MTEAPVECAPRLRACDYRVKSQEELVPGDILDVLEREKLIDLKRDGGLLPGVEGRHRLAAPPEEDEWMED